VRGPRGRRGGPLAGSFQGRGPSSARALQGPAGSQPARERRGAPRTARGTPPHHAGTHAPLACKDGAWRTAQRPVDFL